MEQHFIRFVIRDSAFVCHSCMKSMQGKHLEIFDWMRYLCIPCADTAGRKLVELAKIAPLATTKTEGDLFEARP